MGTVGRSWGRLVNVKEPIARLVTALVLIAGTAACTGLQPAQGPSETLSPASSVDRAAPSPVFQDGDSAQPHSGEVGAGILEEEVDRMIDSRIFLSMLDTAHFLHDCLTLHGISTDVTFDGAISYAPYPAEQTPYVAKIEAYCMSKLDTLLGPRLNNSDPGRLERIYDRNATVASCLTGQGVAVDPLPSLETWVEDRGSWDPLANLAPIDLERLPQIFEECPELLGLNL